MKKLVSLVFILVLISGFTITKASFAVKHVVTVGNFFFNPSSVNVNVGDTIRWVWSAGSHTTTSTPGAIPAGAASWDALITSSVTSFEYKVTVAGSYAYVCTPHAPGMAGTFTAAGITPTLSVTPPNRDVTAAAGVTTFTVTSNSSWTASSNASWCTVTPSGSGNGTINANFSENTTISVRIATITVMVSGLPNQTVTVTQAGAALILAVGPSNQNVPSTTGSTTFDVTSNTSWTVTSDATWCTVDPSGSGNATITANYSANTTNFVRIATITVTVSGLTPQMVTVTQAASTVGVNENHLANLQVYPNPTKGVFKIKGVKAEEQVVEVSVMDISGKKILSGIYNGTDGSTFDITGEPNGYYFVRINSGNNSQVRRITLIE